MKTLILFLITNLTLFSQDIINLKDGNEIYSKVIKISEKEIEYKSFPISMDRFMSNLCLKYTALNMKTER